MDTIEVRLILLVLILALVVTPAMSQTGRIPLTDLGPALYLGQFPGGLYEGGSNTIPTDHAAAGAVQVAQIVPRNTSGAPSPTGRILLVSIGMSNTTQEFCSAASETNKRYTPRYWAGIQSATTRICIAHTFGGQAWSDPAVEKVALEVIDGAQSGMTALEWGGTPNPKSGADPWVELANRIAQAGFSKLQVQAAWVKITNRSPSPLPPALPAPNADVYTYMVQMGNVVRRARFEYPNLRVLFISSRTYAGWSPPAPPSPEPFAYEQGFGVKWLIQAQINQNRGGPTDPFIGPVRLDSAPWLVWGPYLWADGTTPRSDGLTWPRSDFEGDGVHPTVSGEQKVGMWIKDHLKSSPFAMCWFAGGSCAGAMGTRRE